MTDKFDSSLLYEFFLLILSKFLYTAAYNNNKNSGDMIGSSVRFYAVSGSIMSIANNLAINFKISS